MIHGAEEGLLLFSLTDADQWSYISTLKGLEHHILWNNRLRKVFVQEEKLTFVYNNRVIRFNLLEGKCVANCKKKDAKNDNYSGVEITSFFAR